ncbi:MAG: ATP phosphoribosyltransferase regulatory subunit [Anaerolineae bacterium]
MTSETTIEPLLSQRSQIPRGVQDRILAEALRRRQAEAALRRCFAAWGYHEVIPPTFEYYDNLAVGAGPRLEQAMYRFFDRRGRTLALRADFTPQVARIAATKLYDQPMPLRCSYVGSLFRHEEPQAGRQREFTQAGVELVGAGTAGADAEVVALAVAALEALDLPGFQVNLGQVAFFRALTHDLPGDVLAAVRRAIDRKNPARLAEALAGVPPARRDLLARVPDLVGGPGPAATEVLDQARALCAGSEVPEAAGAALARLEAVYRRLAAHGVARRITIDLGEVRGMDYYTGITFRAVAPGLGWPVASGGRYDDLLARFGRPLAAVGLGLSVGRALLVQDPGRAPALAPHLLAHNCHRPECLALVAQLRRAGCRVEVDVLGLDDGDLTGEARRRGIARTLRCAGRRWLLADEGGERLLDGEALIREAAAWPARQEPAEGV